MRATWFTSLLAGVLIGMAARVSELADLDGSVVLILFAAAVPLAVVGLPQLGEAYAERKRRGSIRLTRDGDLAKFYLPTWGRMFAFFGSCVISVVVMKRLGL